MVDELAAVNEVVMSAQVAPAPFHRETERCRIAQLDWASRSLSDRLICIRGALSALATHRQAMADAVEKDLGRLPVETLPGEIFGLAEACVYLLRRAANILRTRKAPRADRPIWLFRQTDYVVRRPRGVIGIIGTWNFPLFLNGVQIVQALAAGNGVIWKPSEVAPKSAEALAAWLRAARFPDDLFIQLPSDREVGRLLSDADVDHVVFTGHVSTGRLLAAHLGRRLISSTLELSGCDAQFVLDDADVEMAAKAAWFGCTVNSGQTCIAVRRAFVPRSRYDEFLSYLTPLAKAAQPQHLMTRGQIQTAEELVGEAVASGARLLARRPLSENTDLFTPAIIADVEPEMAICQRDSFAPILAVLPYDDLKEALETSRRCEYELGVSVFTRRPRRAVALAERLGAGMCTVNDVIVPTAHPATPFGGRGASGWGSTQGAEGLLEMTVPQVISIRGGSFRPHYEPAGSTKTSSLPFFEAMYQWQYAPNFGQRLKGLLKLIGVLLRKT